MDHRRQEMPESGPASPTPGPLPLLEVEQPYHVLSAKKKWNLVIFVSLAGAFSPLSSNIYFPAIDTISRDLGVSTSSIALTITTYMVVQGIAPSLFGAFSDTCGRRLSISTSLLIYGVANLALAFTSNFPMLLVLRGLQAAGSAATISISAGVIADIACPQERGGFMGTNAGVRMSGQAIGPILGGALNSAWGFRSIFWLLFVLGMVVLAALLIFLPETQRSKAGNGSIPLSGFQKPLAYYIRRPKAWASQQDPVQPKSKAPLSLKKAFAPLAYIVEKDIATLLAWGAIAYTAWSMVTSSTTTTLLKGYPFLNDWELGLCFLPNGLGCIVGSLGTGWLLDHDYKNAEARYQSESENRRENGDEKQPFPLVKTRLHLMPYFSAGLIICLALYGPSFEFNDLHRHLVANLAAPLILQFCIALSATAIFNINSTMLIDCFPDRPASATALNNLCRCLLGAAGVSVIQPLIDAVKVMKAFFILTGIVALFTPLIWVQWKWGEKWKRQRDDRLESRR